MSENVRRERQARLLSLYDWYENHLQPGATKEMTIERLTREAQALFGVTIKTGRDYGMAVYAKYWKIHPSPNTA